MADMTPQPARGLGRGALLRNTVLAGAGAAVASVALPSLTGVARAAIVVADAENPFGNYDEFSVQTEWRWCTQCSGLFQSTSGGAAGSCPFHGSHVPCTWLYETPVLT